MVDYRKFLERAEELVAPWLGGRTIDAPGRRLRLTQAPAAPGWYRFELKGRLAAPRGRAEAPDLSALPRVRGVLWRDRLVVDGARTELLRLMPEEEPPRLSPVSARRWHGGALLFDGVDFESEAEGAVREALGQGSSLTGIKGVPAPLRAAYAFALGEQVARKRGITVTAAELRGHVAHIAATGEAGANEALDALVAERALAERELKELHQRLAAAQLRAEFEAQREARARDRQRHQETVEVRAFQALDKAGAEPESCRNLAGNQAEVVFSYLSERFICIVDVDTLQVVDSGICLGHPPADRLLTLESLPSVIKEAIDTNALVILRAP
jgi:hypothetical protein